MQAEVGNGVAVVSLMPVENGIHQLLHRTTSSHPFLRPGSSLLEITNAASITGAAFCVS
jgi:hypothetical protein